MTHYPKNSISTYTLALHVLSLTTVLQMQAGLLAELSEY